VKKEADRLKASFLQQKVPAAARSEKTLFMEKTIFGRFLMVKHQNDDGATEKELGLNPLRHKGFGGICTFTINPNLWLNIKTPVFSIKPKT
jgi:hypothetical protein